MILVDANILIYAYDASAKQHLEAKTWWEEKLSDGNLVYLSPTTILAFLRIVTHIRIFESPFTLEEACAHVSSWLEIPLVQLLHPTDRHWKIFQNFLVQTHASGNLVMDAFLAALALEHGLTLCSLDNDFSRFPDLKWQKPF